MPYNGRDYLKSNAEYLAQCAELYNKLANAQYEIGCKTTDWYIEKYFGNEAREFQRAASKLRNAIADHIEKLRKEK